MCPVFPARLPDQDDDPLNNEPYYPDTEPWLKEAVVLKIFQTGGEQVQKIL